MLLQMYFRFLTIVNRLLEPLSDYQKIAVNIGIAFVYIVVGLSLGFLLRFLSLFLMRKLGISRIIDRFFEADIAKKKYQVDAIIAKSLSWFIFTLFIREAVKWLGFVDVEKFLSDLIAYLPSLFLAVMIGFFGIRFSNTIYTVVYNSFAYYEDEQTSKVLGILAKGVVLFFTFMIMLKYVQIVDQFIINVIFVGFVATLSLTFGLAFGLGGKEFARDVLFRLKHPKKHDNDDK